MAALAIQGSIEERRAPRDEVLHPVRGTGPDGRTHRLLLVNISPGGFMARVDADWPEGAVEATLPVIGRVRATIRWSLGGRIGCQLEEAVSAAVYPLLLGSLTKG